MSLQSESPSAIVRAEFLDRIILNHLVGIRSTFALGLRFWALLRNPRTADVVGVHRVVVKTDGIYGIAPGKQMYIEEGERFYLLELTGPRDVDFEHAATEFVKMHLRTFVTESFEKLRGYCESTGQERLFKRQPWYQFARLVRNSLKHSQHWSFNSYDLTILPTSWHDKSIDAEMNGQEMTWEFFDAFDSLELWDDMYDFAKTIR